MIFLSHGFHWYVASFLKQSLMTGLLFHFQSDDLYG